MSLTLTALADPRSQIDSLQRALREKSERIAELEEQLRQERLKSSGIEVGAANLRVTLEPLYQALQLVFGHIDAMGVRDYAPPIPDTKRTAWESWKQKLGGLSARAIDVLLAHGSMNRTQLRIQLACATRSVTDVVYKLNQAGLINKQGNQISLKEL